MTVNNGILIFRQLFGVAVVHVDGAAAENFSVEVAAEVIVFLIGTDNGVVDDRSVDADPTDGVRIYFFQLRDFSVSISISLHKLITIICNNIETQSL